MDTFANMDTTVDKNTPYARRIWITTALSLRFNDALTYREIAEQLNISSSAVHKMFTRFRRTGINWPLPEGYTPERLEDARIANSVPHGSPAIRQRYGFTRFRLTYKRSGRALSIHRRSQCPCAPGGPVEQPDLVPFWFRPSSIFGLLPITVFINSSHVLTLLTSLAIQPHDACSKGESLTGRRPISLSRKLQTSPLPATPVPVGYS